MKKIVLTPNPYRDRNFKYVTLADKLLREAGLETRICLAFDVDRSFELPDNVVLTELNHELRDADLLVCFGGDGTILHASKAATKAGIKSGATVAAAVEIGKLIADRAKAAGVAEVAFDRSGFRYHGRVKALADAARETGLKF